MSTKQSAARAARAPERAPQPAWTPFHSATLPPVDMDMLRDQARATGMPIEALLDVYEETVKTNRIFMNSRYQVNVRECEAVEGPPMLHLSIKRLDKGVVHDWRELQRVKNEIVGPEREALEIYPAESRRVDSANQYHLWVLPEGVRVPFGFDGGRLVIETPGGGAVQRPFEV